MATKISEEEFLRKQLSQVAERLSGIVELTSREAESSMERNEQVTRLQSEASALQRALSEERLRSAHEISKLKSILKLFSCQMDEAIQIEVFGVGHLGVTPKSLKEEKEKRESLECGLTKAPREPMINKDMLEKTIADMENSLQEIISEREKHLSEIESHKASNDDLEIKVDHLNGQIKELKLESEVLHTKLMKSMQRSEGLNQQLCVSSSKNEEKDKALAEMEKGMKDMSEEVERLSSDKELLVEMVEQQLGHMEAKQSLQERKGAVVCRGVRRLLAAKRRRVELLQERLQEVREG